MNRTTFHQKNQERAENWPDTLLSTSTHDTKRGEDVRARINVLSEIPELWDEVINRWYAMNHKLKIKKEGEFIPDENEEYLLYQTLIGSWPLYPMDAEAQADYRKRIQRYMIKAIKEAKIHTSWINPNKNYEDGMEQFIKSILNFDSKNPFIAELQAFTPKIITAGMLNSLSQILIKATSPGIPDFYQGNEIWEFSLVDPDNRGPVDFEKRRNLLKTICDAKEGGHGDLLRELLQHPEDGRIKLMVTAYALHTRKRLSTLFEKGSYLPLTVVGEKQNHLIAYARTEGKKTAIVIASRFFASLMSNQGMIMDPAIWRGTHVDLPIELNEKRFRNIFTQMEVTIDKNHEGQPCIDLGGVLAPLSVALLESVD